MQLPSRSKVIILILVFIIGLLLRLYFLQHFSFTNDEGAYLYDAQTLLNNLLPGGDVVTKTPVVILIFSFFVFLTDNSLYATRIASLLFGIVALLPLFVITRYVIKGNLLICLIVWLLFSSPVVLMNFGHTESIASFFAASAIACLMLSLQRKHYLWALLGGISFVLAVGARKINLVLIFPLTVLLLNNLDNEQSMKKASAYFSVGAFFAIILLGGFVFRLYGSDGLMEFAGVGYTRIITSNLTGDSRVDIWGISFLETVKILGRAATSHFVVLGMIIIASVFKISKRRVRDLNNPLLIFYVWLFALTIFYAIWPTFLPDYAVDFLVPVTILGLWIFDGIWVRAFPHMRFLIVLFFILVNLLSFYSVIKSPWTGMFSVESSKAMAELTEKFVPKDEAILTAATIIPYVSGHRTQFNISHPLWYRYEFISNEQKTLFMPPWESVASVIKNGEVNWILMEHLTDYAYFRNTDQLINLLDRDWELVATVPNDTGFRSNTLKLYQRKK